MENKKTCIYKSVQVMFIGIRLGGFISIYFGPG